MSEQVFGIPSQMFMDMLMVISSSDGDYPLLHCRGSSHIAFTLYDTETGVNLPSPCVPVDATKYPNWKCIHDTDSYAGGDSHHNCLRANDPSLGSNKEVWFCTCSELYHLVRSPLMTYTPPNGKVLAIRNYFVNEGECDEDGYYKCAGCFNNKCRKV